ncbi:DUF309 domain-containing protein [Ammoniphilus sp. CFH 90114]|uniref:DUF309 domain-containing protein n=1 Tax=Ammoniphilus sp. CFH 90114 TaxID=2493665 RepID=UPI00100E74E3|nr:DUF309 domain-containing protein [Ammoniphilus sp. CFH 90114]RXT08101.1 DUF309 domain-containing protein [Ammoniphilus sp. CFH 90114]
MEYPIEYIEFLVHFHGDRDFFECHEILEEYWKSEEERSDKWVALIQLAVGLYHHRRGNYAGARKMLESSLKRMDSTEITQLGLDYEKSYRLIQERIKQIEQGLVYTDLNLAINDPELLTRCLEECDKKGMIWQGRSGEQEELIHRHTLRDRSDVIAAREEQKMKKRRT